MGFLQLRNMKATGLMVSCSFDSCGSQQAPPAGPLQVGGILASGRRAAYTGPEGREDKEWRQRAKEEWAGDSLEGRSRRRKTGGGGKPDSCLSGRTGEKPRCCCPVLRGLQQQRRPRWSQATLPSQPVATGTGSSDPAITDEAEGVTFRPEARESTPEMARNSTPPNHNVRSIRMLTNPSQSDPRF